MVDKLICTRCKEDKDKSEFSKDPTRGRRHNYWCKSCVNIKSKEHYKLNPQAWRERHLKRSYDMTQDSYLELYNKQNGSCAICEESYPTLNIDHDHETGKIRGLLCSDCNKGLGMFEDNPETIRSAIDYLISHGQ